MRAKLKALKAELRRRMHVPIDGRVYRGTADGRVLAFASGALKVKPNRIGN